MPTSMRWVAWKPLLKPVETKGESPPWARLPRARRHPQRGPGRGAEAKRRRKGAGAGRAERRRRQRSGRARTRRRKERGRHPRGLPRRGWAAPRWRCRRPMRRSALRGAAGAARRRAARLARRGNGRRLLLLVLEARAPLGGASRLSGKPRKGGQRGQRARGGFGAGPQAEARAFRSLRGGLRAGVSACGAAARRRAADGRSARRGRRALFAHARLGGPRRRRPSSAWQASAGAANGGFRRFLRGGLCGRLDREASLALRRAAGSAP